MSVQLTQIRIYVVVQIEASIIHTLMVHLWLPLPLDFNNAFQKCLSPPKYDLPMLSVYILWSEGGPPPHFDLSKAS